MAPDTSSAPAANTEVVERAAAVFTALTAAPISDTCAAAEVIASGIASTYDIVGLRIASRLHSSSERRFSAAKIGGTRAHDV